MKNLLTLIALLLIVGVQVSCTHSDNIVSNYRYKRAMRLLQNKHGYDDQTAVMQSVPKLIEQEEYQLALEILNTYELVDDSYEPLYQYRLLVHHSLGETHKAIDDAIKYCSMADVIFYVDTIQKIFAEDVNYSMTQIIQLIQSFDDDDTSKEKHDPIYLRGVLSELFGKALQHDDEQSIELYKRYYAQKDGTTYDIDYKMAKWYARIGMYDRAIEDISKYIDSTNGTDQQAISDLAVFKRMEELTYFDVTTILGDN